MLKPLNQSEFILPIIKDLGMYNPPNSTASRTYRYVILLCSCGKEITTPAALGKQTHGCKSCGNTKHGKAKRGQIGRLYSIYHLIRQRILDASNRDYPNYGGRGLSMSDEWGTYEAFESWALSNGYDKNLSIDRIDNNRGYFPDNCRWTTNSVQAQNKRKMQTRKTTSQYKGVTYNKRQQKWIARISINNVRIFLGAFFTEKEAAHSYNAWAIKNNSYHILNNIKE